MRRRSGPSLLAPRQLLDSGSAKQRFASASVYGLPLHRGVGGSRSRGRPIVAASLDAPHYPASLVKLMTGMLAWDLMRDPNEAIHVEEGDLRRGSGNNLRHGDVLTVDEALHNLLIRSSNTTAQALARHLGRRLAPSGDAVEAFVAEMNKRAIGMGMSATQLTDPSGLYDPDMCSSARDVATLAREAVSYDRLRQILSKTSHQLQIRGGNEPRVRKVSAPSACLSIPGVLGGKTGTRRRKPRTFHVVVLLRTGRRGSVLGVLMGAPDDDARAADVRTLLELVGYSPRTWGPGLAGRFGRMAGGRRPEEA